MNHLLTNTQKFKLRYSIIIPTYNRIDELLKTLPQIIEILDSDGELIIIDQSDKYDIFEYKSVLQAMIEGKNIKYFYSRTPSTPLAWNSAAKIAKGEILIFLDDDIDLEGNIVKAHLAYYEKQNIIGVAGSYYAGRKSREWIPSSNSKTATSLAGANMSFRRDIFCKIGAATWFIKPFAGVDWELAEIMGREGKIAVGETCFVFHRAPSEGGSGNQGIRGFEWYYGAYYNHTLWILSRPTPECVTVLPRHFYWLLRYCLPKKSILLNKNYYFHSIARAIKDARKTYISSKNIRGNSFDINGLEVIVDSAHQAAS